jgi:glycosyltransferase involved in cell wall biosynthesis
MTNGLPMQQPPDVALIAPYPPAGERHGGHSGVASYTANLAHALANAGANVTVVAPRLAGEAHEPDDFTDGPVTVQRRFDLGPAALPRAAAAAAHVGAPVVHLQWELFLYGGPMALAGLAPALVELRRSGTPLVTTMHQVLDPATIDRRTTALHRVGLPAPLARVGIGSVQRAIAAASDATVVHEHPFRRLVAGSTMIPHGVESPKSGDRTAARRRLGLDDRLVVLCFGFLAPYKGLELAADAAALAGPDVHMVFAGGSHPRLTDDGGDRYLDDLKRLSGDAATYTGWVDDDDVATWFAAADVALFPYPKPFSASGALALALAHDTPVLLSPALARCVGAPSAVTASMDATELAGQLDQLAFSQRELDAQATWTRVLSGEREWPAVARRHLDLYEEVCDGQHPSGRRVRAA